MSESSCNHEKLLVEIGLSMMNITSFIDSITTNGELPARADLIAGLRKIRNHSARVGELALAGGEIDQPDASRNQASGIAQALNKISDHAA